MKKISQMDDVELLRIHYKRNQSFNDTWPFIIGATLLFGWFLYAINLGIFIAWLLIILITLIGRSGDDFSEAIKNEVKRRDLEK